jgi:exosortase A
VNASGAFAGRVTTTQTSVRDALWRRHLLALALLAGALLILFRRDVADVAGIWWSSSTYAHCLLIPLIIGWLVWQRAPALRMLTPRAWVGGLALVGVGAAGWLLGALAGAAVARHLGLLMMLQGSVVALLGPAVARGLLFPLFYALFLVPVGDVLVPPLQTITAKMCMVLLALFGVPAHVEGVFIWIPNGYFEVAEACSGAKFLVAMVAYGVLVANVCFRSWVRRIAFLALAVAVPVLANGLRAFGTIYVASLTTADAAAGFDHVVYGWIFFGVVIAIVMAVGWPFFDRAVDDPWFNSAQIGDRPGQAGLVAPIAAAVFGIAAAAAFWSAGSLHAGPRSTIRIPDVPGWSISAIPQRVAWGPHYEGADLMETRRYADAAGDVVDLGIAIFDAQVDGREVVGFGQGAVAPGSRWAWANDSAPPPGGRAFRISAPGAMREVALFQQVAGEVTGSDTRVKLLTLRERLMGRPARAVAILVSAEGPQARVAIDRFLRALGPIDRAAMAIAPPPRQP